MHRQMFILSYYTCDSEEHEPKPHPALCVRGPVPFGGMSALMTLGVNGRSETSEYVVGVHGWNKSEY